MARGWESKSAEEQADRQIEQREEIAKGVEKRALSDADAVKARARQLLELKRERILSEKTSHPARRSALQSALQEIEIELERLNSK